jgi:hypothetical protein
MRPPSTSKSQTSSNHFKEAVNSVEFYSRLLSTSFAVRLRATPTCSSYSGQRKEKDTVLACLSTKAIPTMAWISISGRLSPSSLIEWMTVTYMPDNPDSSNRTTRLDLDSLPVLQAFPKGIDQLREVPESAESSETWDFITSQLEHCHSNHAQCNRNLLDSILPSRLLQVDKHHSNVRVNLVDTAATTTGRYAALSHSWGYTPARPPLATTRSNLKQTRDGIDISRAPLTL